MKILYAYNLIISNGEHITLPAAGGAVEDIRISKRYETLKNTINALLLTVALGFTGTAPPTNTVHSNYCNTELHTSRKCHCSAVVISDDVGVHPVIRSVDDCKHILHCTVTWTPADSECGIDSF